MADTNPTGLGTAKCPTTFDEDEREEAAVLRQVLELHPDVLTRDELIREMTGGGPKGFSDVDALERAIRQLAGTGLLHQNGDVIRPTRAAVNFAALMDV